MCRREFIAYGGTALTAAVAGCSSGDDGGDDDGDGSDETEETETPVTAPSSGENYENLTYTIDESGEEVSRSSGYSRSMDEYNFFGYLTVGPEDCYTSGVTDVSITEELAEVRVAPVEKDDAPEECSGTVVQHRFTVSMTIPEVDPERRVVIVEDHEDGEKTLYDSENSGF